MDKPTQQRGGESGAEKFSPSKLPMGGSASNSIRLPESRGGRGGRPEQSPPGHFFGNANANAYVNANTAIKEETVEKSTWLGSTKSLQEISRVSHSDKELLLRRGGELGSTKSLQELKPDQEFPVRKRLEELKSRRTTQEAKSKESQLGSSAQEVLLRRGEELGSARSLEEFQLVPVAENVRRAILIQVKEEAAKTDGRIVGGGQDLVTLKIPERGVKDREEEALKRSKLKAEKEKELKVLRAEEMERLKERKVKRDEEIEKVKQKILELERAREELLEKKGSRQMKSEEEETNVKDEEMEEEEKKKTREQDIVQQAEMRRRTEETWKGIQLQGEGEEGTLMKTQDESQIKEGEGDMKEKEKEEERKERVLRLREEIRRRRRKRLEGEATLKAEEGAREGEKDIRDMAAAESNMEGPCLTSTMLDAGSMNNVSLKEAAVPYKEDGKDQSGAANLNSDQKIQKPTLGFDQKVRDDQPPKLSEEEDISKLKLSHIYRQPPTRLSVK